MIFHYLLSKIVNNEQPDNFHELVPPLVAANVNHNLRSSHNYMYLLTICLFTNILTFHVLFKHGILLIVLLEFFLRFPLLD
jgi:hypothetical protein